MGCLVVVRKRLAIVQAHFCEGFSFLLNLVLKRCRLCRTRRSLTVARILVSVVFFLVVRIGSPDFAREQLAVCRENVLLVWWFAVL